MLDCKPPSPARGKTHLLFHHCLPQAKQNAWVYGDLWVYKALAEE